jgi:hypothetical protein
MNISFKIVDVIQLIVIAVKTAALRAVRQADHAVELIMCKNNLFN